MTAWALLILAGLLECGWAISLKASNGMTRLWPTVSFIALAIISLLLLNAALKELPVGSAYAVWTGIGAAGTAAVGILFLGETVSALRLASIALIIVGVAGLRAGGGTPVP